LPKTNEMKNLAQNKVAISNWTTCQIALATFGPWIATNKHKTTTNFQEQPIGIETLLATTYKDSRICASKVSI